MHQGILILNSQLVTQWYSYAHIFKIKSVLSPTHNMSKYSAKQSASVKQSAIDSGQHCQQQANIMLTLHFRLAANKDSIYYFI